MKTKPNGVLKVEKGIPIPNIRGGKGIISTLRQLEVGDSILLHGSRSAAVNSAQYVFGVGNYTSRKDGDGFRIWRTK